MHETGIETYTWDGIHNKDNAYISILPVTSWEENQINSEATFSDHLECIPANFLPRKVKLPRLEVLIQWVKNFVRIASVTFR